MVHRGAGCGKAACPVLRGAGGNCGTVQILWHRRETRRQQRKQIPNLRLREPPAYSNQSQEEQRRHRRSEQASWSLISGRLYLVHVDDHAAIGDETRFTVVYHLQNDMKGLSAGIGWN